MTVLHRLRRKVFKRWAKNAFFPQWRVALLRWCGVEIGNGAYIADGLTIVEELDGRHRVSLGERVSLGPNVTLVTSSHPNHSTIQTVAPTAAGPIMIGADAWIGAGAVILPGVTIGRGAVIGALSVVTSDVPELAVVAGQPARQLRTLARPSGWT